MSIGESISGVWHKHPYVILGVGGVIALYFLWPSSSASSSTASSDPYANQLAAETALSQSQLAEQAQVALGAQAEQVAADQSVATSNSAIAQSNAAAIISYNQTAQAGIAGETALGVAQTQAGQSDFSALTAGLTAFGAQSQAGAASGSANGLDAYLTSIGATFSDTHGPNSFEAQDTGAAGSGVSNLNQQGLSTYYNNYGSGFSAGAGYGGASGESSGWDIYGGPATPLAQIAGAANLGTMTTSANSPFAASDNLLGGLWAKAISAYSTNQASVIKSIPTPAPVTGLTLAGSIQQIGAAA